MQTAGIAEANCCCVCPMQAALQQEQAARQADRTAARVNQTTLAKEVKRLREVLVGDLCWAFVYAARIARVRDLQ